MPALAASHIYTMEAPLRDKEFPRVIFVTGGPGTGKGTQCANLVTELGYSHVSVGDIMREEIRSGSEEG